jgi:hypothetical protein
MSYFNNNSNNLNNSLNNPNTSISNSSNGLKSYLNTQDDSNNSNSNSFSNSKKSTEEIKNKRKLDTNNDNLHKDKKVSQNFFDLTQESKKVEMYIYFDTFKPAELAHHENIIRYSVMILFKDISVIDKLHFYYSKPDLLLKNINSETDEKSVSASIILKNFNLEQYNITDQNLINNLSNILKIINFEPDSIEIKKDESVKIITNGVKELQHKSTFICNVKNCNSVATHQLSPITFYCYEHCIDFLDRKIIEKILQTNNSSVIKDYIQSFRKN